MTAGSRTRGIAGHLLAAFIIIGMALPAAAQMSNATVRGVISAPSDFKGSATIVATQIDTGYSVRTTSTAEGAYTLSALPPGTYRIVVSAPETAPTSQLITVLVGQNVSLNLTLSPDVPSGAPEQVVVTSARDTRTSEVGTSVTRKQIETLPQTTRNFLAFADLAPGVAFITNSDGSTQLRSGAQPASETNVYIDGVGQKNYVTQGGITGQDSSRGNPFPQSAISEYRVITQNYKAEYDQLSGAAVTAVTRSGTNDFHGEVFWDHSQTHWRAHTPVELRDGRKTESKDDQYGVWLGGPIVQDKAHWFLAYEGKRIDSPKSVVPGQGRTVGDLPPDLQGLIGGFAAPFREDLLFGKIDWFIDDSNLLEFTVKLRDETETTNLQNQNTQPWSTDKLNDETRLDLRYQRSSDRWVNDAHLTYEKAFFNPRATTLGPGYVLTTSDRNQVILNAGGGRDFQRKGQKGYALQDDLTLSGLEWHGNHVFKLGAKVKRVTVEAREQQPFNPQFFYDIDQSFTVPYLVQFGAPLAGLGDGTSRSKNTQIGIYVQDDWQVNQNLTFNLGVRYDYERSPTYLNYVTPPEVVDALRAFAGANAAGSGVNVDDYISTGNNRKSFKDAWQPRLGFSFDLDADQQHVIYGGVGRAYDRNLFDYLQLETTKGTFPSYDFFFNTPGHDCTANPDTCLAWDPAYLDPAVLAPLATGTGAGREISLLNNHLKTPYSDQFSLGMRNRVGDWNTEVAYSHVRSKDGFAFLLGNRREDGTFFAPGTIYGAPFGFGVPGFGALILGTNGLSTRSNALFLKAEKPYSDESGWGVGMAYTYTRAKENRQFGERFSLDYPSLADYGWKQAGGVARHRFVFTGIKDLPYDFVLSARLTLATHAPRYGLNCLNSPANDPNTPQDESQSLCVIDQLKPEGGHFLVGGPIWGYRQLDFAISKDFPLAGGRLRLRADVINVLNFKNYSGYNTTWGVDGQRNADFGQPDLTLAGPPRTLKLGLAYAW